MDWNRMMYDYMQRLRNKYQNSLDNMANVQQQRSGKLGSSIVNGLFGVLGTVIQNAYNTKQQKMTNEHNERLVQQQNAFAKQESELSYQRSRAENQVANLMNTGMSRAGAINAINGGGHYQPAPVNTSQAQAPQLDLSSAINAVQASTQMALQEKLTQAEIKAQSILQDKSIASTERMQKAQLESNERIAELNAITSRYGADRGYEGTKYSVDMQKTIADIKHSEFIEELQYKNDDLQFRKDQYEYGKKLVDAQTDLTNAQKDDIIAKLEEWKSDPAKNAREAKYQVETLAAQYNYKVNEAEMQKYLHDHFVYDKDTDTYVPFIRPNKYSSGTHGSLKNAEQIAKDFWDLLFSIIPIKPLLESIKLFG